MMKEKKDVGLWLNLRTVTPRCLMLLTKSLMERGIWKIWRVTAKRMMETPMSFKIKRIQLKHRSLHHKTLGKAKEERQRKMQIRR